VTPKPIRTGLADDWLDARRILRLRLPTWTFGGQDWRSSAFDA
jgi:hypothetical protein